MLMRTVAVPLLIKDCVDFISSSKTAHLGYFPKTGVVKKRKSSDGGVMLTGGAWPVVINNLISLRIRPNRLSYALYNTLMPYNTLYQDTPYNA